MALYNTLNPASTSQLAVARAMPLGKAQVGKSRVSMSIPATARVAPPPATDPIVVQRLRSENRLADLPSPAGNTPSALDTVSTKIAEADLEATRLGTDVVVQPASLAHP